MKERFNLAAIIEELEEQKRMVMSAAELAKKDFLHTMEDVEENLEELDVDVNEVKIKATVVKHKLMEELEEIQQMLSELDLSDKTKEIVNASQEDLQESWDAAKEVIGKAEDKMAEIVKKQST